MGYAAENSALDKINVKPAGTRFCDTVQLSRPMSDPDHEESDVNQIRSDNGPSDETTYKKALNQIRINMRE